MAIGQPLFFNDHNMRTREDDWPIQHKMGMAKDEVRGCRRIETPESTE